MNSESTKTEFTMKDKKGNQISVPFDVREYQAAETAGLTLTQHLTQKYGKDTDEAAYGSVIGQFMASAGMFLGEDNVTGLKSPTMHAVATGGIQVGAITRNDGSSSNTPSGRLLFPEILMRTIESELRESNDDFLNGWESMIAQTASISGPKFDQPIINVKAPESSESNPIAQLAPPDAMVSITVSDVSRNIPTKSIGLMISDQAQQASTLDLVSLAMTAQARGERIRMIEGHLNTIINGSVDEGNEGALASVQADSFDPLVTVAGTITHKAYIKYLRSQYQKRSLNRIICDIDTALALEGRTGKPTRDTVLDQSNTSFPTGMSVDNLMISSPSILLMDTAVVGANTVIGLDSRFAIRRVINVNAQYSAIENFLMRRATGFRIDYGEVAHRLYTDAFSKMTLTV